MYIVEIKLKNGKKFECTVDSLYWEDMCEFLEHSDMVKNYILQ